MPPSRPTAVVINPPSGYPHAYFDALRARPDCWGSYSLRDPAFLATRAYHSTSYGYTPARQRVTYAPSSDTYPQAQDAAKVEIRTWDVDFVNIWLAEPIPIAAPGALTGPIRYIHPDSPTYGPSFDLNVPTRFGTNGEIVTITANDRTALTITVRRGHLGTTPTTHASGAPIVLVRNSLNDQLRVPLQAPHGSVYLITWDGYWTTSYLASATGLTNHKSFQLSSGTGDGIWTETQTRFDGQWGEPGFQNPTHVCAITGRAYLGPNTTLDPMQPLINRFNVTPNTWTRFWWILDTTQTPTTNLVAISLWVADEAREARQLLDRFQQTPRPGATRIEKFWLEFNTSSSRNLITPDRPWMIAYVRNVVVLRDPTDIPALLQRPVVILSK